jgi:uncharacterized membrane protein
MFTAIAAAACGAVMLTVFVLAVGWLRTPSTVDAAAIEAGLR